MCDARRYRNPFSRHRVTPPTPPPPSPPSTDDEPSAETYDPAAELEGDPDEPYVVEQVLRPVPEAYYSDASYESERETASTGSAPSSHHSSGSSSGSVSVGYGSASSGSASGGASDDDLSGCYTLPNAASYEERKANKDYRLEEVLECLCLEGREWVRHKDGRPHFLKRNDLEPMAKGWYDFVCRSIMPTSNRSELTVERAVLIHSIIIGENINVEEIIAEQFYKFIYKTDLSSSLPFPSIIAALCLDAKVVPHKDDTMIPPRNTNCGGSHGENKRD
ncbi:hypothetical protein PIB30_066197 [Stylosanthes scabra]|uniref:Putative plant transposon protein domain-containing protein n=1 Tax=Stylosanthes scabra TaxID=79078 RepID=A0ABU6UN84_9FABA|nr:hypothetical protein [Stylosanthes scabra]